MREIKGNNNKTYHTYPSGKDKICGNCKYRKEICDDNRYFDAHGWAGTIDVSYECRLNIKQVCDWRNK